MKKTGLGRGLGILIPAIDETPEEVNAPRDAVAEIAIGLIDPNREQPRKRFEEESLKELADSIAQSGVIQPILLSPREGRYVIIAGERRWRAARLAGLTTIPAILRDWDRVKQMEASLIENIQRENLNSIEEAAAILRLMEECGLTQEAVAQRVARSRPAVANLLRLLSLPKTMQQAVIDEKLTAGHARVLAGIENEKRRQTLFEQTLANGWSVRQLEAAASKKVVQPPKKALPTVEIREMEERLLHTLGMKAQITGNAQKGRIVLSYFSAAELERLSDMLSQME